MVLDAPSLILDAPSLVLDAPSLILDAPSLVLDAPSLILDALDLALAFHGRLCLALFHQFVGEENVLQVVTDNAANFKAGGELLMQKREHLYWTPCAAHCIDLIFEDFEKQLKVHETTIKKGRRITTYIYGRAMLITIL